ncbi:hypothetical protein GVN21_19920 [Caulobacter sp. SLTY]|uniref:hypothetical protein n=1 Tax=Caulobacter sp. SLTY TaxID=2683262 RepID=UPI00141286D0|nr:hypothetical protein [Caulobacter sp. SLTY]NBB17634.1 hypothetical protein [Caulobacter sp. SLTY]
MSDPPRRPILKLKFPPAVAPAPPAAPAAAPEPPPGERWRCKPCSGIVVITGEEAPDSDIRCPACNARLGLAGEFQRPDGKVRARRLPR